MEIKIYTRGILYVGTYYILLYVADSTLVLKRWDFARISHVIFVIITVFRLLKYSLFFFLSIFSSCIVVVSGAEGSNVST